MVVPVIALARGDERNAAALPTSSAVSFSVSGAFTATYSTIFSMIPIALAARDASGPAEIVFTRHPNRLPASNANVRVSLSRAVFANDIPPPYPGITRSLARYVIETNEPPGRRIGPNRLTIEMSEYALALIAAKYPSRLTS